MWKFSDLSSLIQWWCGQKQLQQEKRRRLTSCGCLAPKADKLYFSCLQNEMPQKSVITIQQVISPSSKFTPQFIHSVTLTGTVHAQLVAAGKKIFLPLAKKKKKKLQLPQGHMRTTGWNEKKKRYIKLRNVFLDTTFKKSASLKEGRKLVSYSALALYNYNNQHSCWHRTHRQQKSTSFPMAAGEKTNAACFTFIGVGH